VDSFIEIYMSLKRISSDELQKLTMQLGDTFLGYALVTPTLSV